MSLVNDMLRDLDKRKQLPAHARRVNIIAYPEERRVNYAVLAGLVAVCVLAGFGSAYLFLDKDPLEVAVIAPRLVEAVPAVLQEKAAVVEAVAAAGAELSIAEEANSADGFTLRLQASEAIDFSVVESDRFGIKLQLSGVSGYSKPQTSVAGMHVLQSQDETLVEFELDNPVDFHVYEDSATAGFDIVVAATYRETAPAAAVADILPLRQIEVETPADTIVVGNSVVGSSDTAPGMAGLDQPLYAPQPVAASTPSAPRRETANETATGQRESPVRVNRGLSLEQLDRNTSQQAVAMVQQGRIFEAYEALLGFVSSNPSAHYSRETLATILFAQNEYAQASVVVDDGLRLAPNFASYKKIKARLLMQEGNSAEALALLRSLPPELSGDAEYHELLASLYQQNNQHESAVSTYQELLRTNAQQGRWWTGLGISLEAQGKHADAIASFQAALQTGSLDAGLRQYTQARIRNLAASQ